MTQQLNNSSNVGTALKKQRTSKIISKILVYTFLIIVGITTIFPFYWMINVSLQSLFEYRLGAHAFPQEIHWQNYINAFQASNFLQYMLNTVIVGLISTSLGLVITVLAAFAFARLEFRGKELLFTALLATMMIPGELFQISNFITVSNMEIKNTYMVLIVPFLVSVFYVFLLRNNFKQIPNELYYAAKVDGTSDLKYLLKVMVPLSMPTLISITILKLMGSWNSYIWPRLVNATGLYLGGGKYQPMRLLSNWLTTSFTDGVTGETDYPMKMAAVVIVSIPLLIVFIFFRKYIMRGVSKSGIKG